MKYTAAALIALLSVLALSCGSDSSDTSQESEVEPPSELDADLADNEIDSVSAADEPGKLASLPGTDKYTADPLPAEPAANDEDFFLLGNGRAGLFEVGMHHDAIEEIAQAYGDVELEEVDLMLEGMHAPAVKITFPQDSSETMVLELDIENATVYRINVFSDRFVTNKGIGTASTFGDLKDTYQFEGVFWGETGNPLVIIEELSASVILVPGEWW
ncbi:MAG: hypothetical protein KAT47_05950, partial [Candidatus Aegiribacteria sp.]|nr:hypothetical protein [Candidatus Aegiribacteria sp.]